MPSATACVSGESAPTKMANPPPTSQHRGAECRIELLMRFSAPHAVERFGRLQAPRQIQAGMHHEAVPAVPRKLREPSSDCPPSHTQMAPVM